MAKGRKALRDRRAGRRALASPEVIAKHDKIILAEIRKREVLEEQVAAQTKVIAERCHDAMEDGVETSHIGEKLLKLSRQMVYKIVRENVFGKTPSGKAVKPPGKPGPKPGSKRKAAPKKATSKPKKASSAKKKPSGKGVAAFAKRPKKAESKEGKKRTHRRPVARSKDKASK